MPVDGALQIAGPVLALRCFAPNGSVTIGDDELVIRLDGVVVARRPHVNGVFPATPIDLDASELFGPAGIAPEVGQSYILTVNREGTACAVLQEDGPAQFYGPPQYELYRVEVQINQDVQGLVFVENADLRNLVGCHVWAQTAEGVQVHDRKEFTAPPVTCQAISGGVATATVVSVQEAPSLIVGQAPPGNALSFKGHVDEESSVAAVFPDTAYVTGAGSYNFADVRFRVGAAPVRLRATALTEGITDDALVSGDRSDNGIHEAWINLEIHDETGTRVGFKSAYWYIRSDGSVPGGFTEDVVLEPGWSVRITCRASSSGSAYASYWHEHSSSKDVFGYSLDLRFDPL
jgi:hypothetical protein